MLLMHRAAVYGDRRRSSEHKNKWLGMVYGVLYVFCFRRYCMRASCVPTFTVRAVFANAIYRSDGIAVNVCLFEMQYKYLFYSRAYDVNNLADINVSVFHLCYNLVGYH